MKVTDNTVQKTTQPAGQNQKRGETTLHQNSARLSEKGIDSGKPKDSLLLTKEMAAQRLGCHWQTLIYREKLGQLHPIRIGRRKYYSAGQVELVHRNHPVHSKPHWSKRTPRFVFHQPTLWERIKALFA